MTHEIKSIYANSRRRSLRIRDITYQYLTCVSKIVVFLFHKLQAYSPSNGSSTLQKTHTEHRNSLCSCRELISQSSWGGQEAWNAPSVAGMYRLRLP